MAKKIKTRSTYYQRQMSDEVKLKIKYIADQMGIAQWLVIENLLEKALDIKACDSVDVSEWLKHNHSATRTGKAYKKKR